MLLAQKSQTDISSVDGLPFAQLSPRRRDFTALRERILGTSISNDLERQTWALCNILFNDELQDDISAGVPHHLRAQYLHRIKKDRLSRLWETIIRETAASSVVDIANIPNPEERAVAYLCSHRVEEACQCLIESRNYHLATLVSHIARDRAVQDELKAQIDSWYESKSVSEMTEPIRALWGLLAGNCLRSEGVTSQAFVEDRASRFYLSHRFNLDWIHAFGLRLWYGIIEAEPIELAIEKFFDDVMHNEEPAYPSSPFAVRSAAGANTAKLQSLSLDSPLWSILKIYARSTRGPASPVSPVNIPQDIRPSAVSGEILSNRLSFQLLHYFSSSSSVPNVHTAVSIDAEAADQLISNFAFELSTSHQFPPAIFVLLHLRSPEIRERSIRDFLSRFAYLLPSPQMDDGAPNLLWTYLVTDLRLPAPWIWAAKALLAREDGDAAHEVSYLIRAEQWDEAHDIFCRAVGPNAVIEQDYEALRALLAAFGETPDRKVRRWAAGGAFYEDFYRLVTAESPANDPPRLNRLVATLTSLGDRVEKSESSTLQERVAFREISSLVAGWTVNGKVASVSCIVIHTIYHSSFISCR